MQERHMTQTQTTAEKLALPVAPVLTLLGLLHPGPSAATVAAAALFAQQAQLDVTAGATAALIGAMILQQAAVSLHNNWCDRDLDARTKPWRAIPRGLVPAPAVRDWSLLLAAASLVVAACIGWRVLLADAVFLAAGFAYNAGLKRTIWSWVPFVVGFPAVPLGAWAAVGAVPPLWWTVYLVGLPATLAIHLADTLPDIRADVAAGVWGIAHRLGETTARRLALGLLIVAAAPAAAAWLVWGHPAAIASSAVCLFLTVCGAIAHTPARARLALISAAVVAAVGWVLAVPAAGA
jgi:4-hydroxybenzoate polyprenyltransferase